MRLEKPTIYGRRAIQNEKALTNGTSEDQKSWNRDLDVRKRRPKENGGVSPCLIRHRRSEDCNWTKEHKQQSCKKERKS
jgi:hypothetical protein